MSLNIIDEGSIERPGTLRLDARYLTRKVGKHQTLLDEVSLSILPSEFVAIVGVSGAGKTTLLNALSGFRPADRGQVFINGEALYLNFDAYRAELGYVPQDDIIHRELTVYQALDFSARLRLPPSLPAPERHQLLQSVLADLELSDRQHALVKNLSGGQRKRVSIGVELLTKPRLFFLDEATSGLDPGTERQMMLMLRRLADGGRTVILNTHTTKNVMFCDRVVFLSKGGRLVYYGPPKAALDYFEVEDFDEIYLRVEEERSPQEWQQQYLQSTAYQDYVAAREIPLDLSQKTLQPKRSHRALPRTDFRLAWRQLWLLSQRNLTILVQDRASLILMLLVAPTLGLLDLLMVRRNIFDPLRGDSGQSLTLMFLASLIAVLVGSLSTMREIVKEAEIYRRERMVGLEVLPYLLSKVWLCVLIALYQAAIFWITKILIVDLPDPHFSTRIALYFTLFLATLGGMVMGLLVSALSTSQNVAPLLTILCLVPQITFAGAIFPLGAFGTTGQWISQLTLTRWSYETMVTLSGLGRDVTQDPCWQQPESVRKAWSEADKAKCQCLGPHLFERCRFPGLLKEYNPTVDQPQPLKPKALSDPPTAPNSLLSPAADSLRDDLNAYKAQVKTYRREMDRWQDQFIYWKENRGKALAAGEALIRRVRKTQGGSFAVFVPGHWARLGLIQLGMLGLLAIVQKRKDLL
jgi:ABC transport system ATP-binding/permease protein